MGVESVNNIKQQIATFEEGWKKRRVAIFQPSNPSEDPKIKNANLILKLAYDFLTLFSDIT